MLLQLFFLLFLFPKKKKKKKRGKLLLFKKKRINGINKCPILGIDIYCGVELFNAIYFFFPSESSSVCTQHFRIAVEYTFCAWRMGAMITFMRIMAKYGWEKVRNGIERPLCAYRGEVFVSSPPFRDGRRALSPAISISISIVELVRRPSTKICV